MTRPLLAIDAATYRGTVAIVDGSSVLAERDVQMRGEREERLMPAVADVLRSANVPLDGLGGVVCGGGPGSFTSLRIAASLAKGIAAAAALPMYACSSLLLVVAGTMPRAAPGRYLAVLDAMRGDVFAGRVTVDHSGLARLDALDMVLTDAAAARQLAESEGRTLVGPSIGDWWPHARGVACVGRESSGLESVDLGLWEPAYGRLAEAQVKWEKAHGRSLSA